MTEVIVEISTFLIAAILLGFVFGWLIAKASTKSNKHTGNEDKKIEALNLELAQKKEALLILENKHEAEIEAFLEERIDITRKYKELMEKIAPLT